ncbi:MAG: DUF3575 domain-containing protein [Prevotella sp.]|jgi:hypothetical protein|nr:DUF3575 domain-containing protein [Prevotella sp.]
MKNSISKYILLFLVILCSAEGRAQFYSLGTNIPALGTATINAEVSMTLDRKWSLHLPVYYNPFVFKDNKKLQNFTVMPGVRYWLLESYVNGFIGVNATASKYHITWKNSRYEGKAFGMGISAGYAWLLSPRWNLEIEGGIGLVWTDYTEYECEECGRQKGEYTRWVAVPNKLALSLIYLF